MIRLFPVVLVARFAIAWAALVLITGCEWIDKPMPNKIEFTIVQIGDVVDIRSPMVQRRLKIVAAIKRRLKSENEQTYLIMPGDLFNPSPVSNVDFAGKRVAGRNLVEVMNAVDVDFATFGNHAFDLNPDEFKARLEESTARWVSSNVVEKSSSTENRPFFEEAPPYRIFEVKNSYGKKARIGILGLTMETGGQSRFVARKPPIPAARVVTDQLARKHDLLFAMTHQNLDGDRKLAEAVPEIQAIFGGHENIMTCEIPQKDSNRAPIFKAPLNLSSIWVHRFAFDVEKRTVSIDSEQIFLDVNPPIVANRLIEDDQKATETGPDQELRRRRDDDIESDNLWLAQFEDEPDALGKNPAAKQVKAVLDEWNAQYAASFPLHHERQHDPDGNQKGLAREKHEKAVVQLLPRENLDGREESVRTRPTQLTRLVALAMLDALDQKLGEKDKTDESRKLEHLSQLPRVAIFNSGMVRINDQISWVSGKKAITLDDIQRIVPFFKDPVIKGVTMKGERLIDLLKRGVAQTGEGAFLQAFGATGNSLIERVEERGKEPSYKVNQDIGPDQEYLVAIDDYLVDGHEEALNWPDLPKPGDKRVSLQAYEALKMITGVRIALEHYLEKCQNEPKLRRLWIDPVYEPQKLPPFFPRRTHEIQASTPSAPWNRKSFDNPVYSTTSSDSLNELPESRLPSKVAMDLEENMFLESDPINKLWLAHKLLKLRPRSRRAASELFKGLKSEDAATHAEALQILTKALPDASPALLSELASVRLRADEIDRVELDELIAKFGPEHSRLTTPRKTANSPSESP